MNTYDASIWGPKFWFFLHTLSFAYPEQVTNDVLKKKYYEFIQNLPLFIPDQKIGVEFEKILNEYPLSPYLDSRASFIKWVHYVHNKINEKLGKQTLTLKECYDMYYNHYKPAQAKDVDTIKWKDKLIYLGVIVCMFIFITVLWHK